MYNLTLINFIFIQVTKALEALHKSDVSTIVMDMRNNGGGVLQAAVETAALLIPPGWQLPSECNNINPNVKQCDIT